MLKELLLLLVGAVVGHWLMAGYQSHDRRRAFRGFLRVHVDNIRQIDWKKLPSGGLFQIYNESRVQIAEEAAKIMDDIPSRRRARFDAARLAYRSLQQHEVEPYDKFDPIRNPAALAFPNFEKGKQKLIDLLTTMLEHAR